MRKLPAYIALVVSAVAALVFYYNKSSVVVNPTGSSRILPASANSKPITLLVANALGKSKNERLGRGLIRYTKIEAKEIAASLLARLRASSIDLQGLGAGDFSNALEDGVLDPDDPEGVAQILSNHYSTLALLRRSERHIDPEEAAAFLRKRSPTDAGAVDLTFACLHMFWAVRSGHTRWPAIFRHHYCHTMLLLYLYMFSICSIHTRM